MGRRLPDCEKVGGARHVCLQSVTDALFVIIIKNNVIIVWLHKAKDYGLRARDVASSCVCLRLGRHKGSVCVRACTT